MVSDAGSHRWRSLYSYFTEQARMIGTEVVDSANQVHAGVQAPLSASQVAGASAKRGQSSAEGSVQSLDKGSVEHSPALRLL